MNTAVVDDDVAIDLDGRAIVTRRVETVLAIAIGPEPAVPLDAELLLRERRRIRRHEVEIDRSLDAQESRPVAPVRVSVERRRHSPLRPHPQDRHEDDRGEQNTCHPPHVRAPAWRTSAAKRLDLQVPCRVDVKEGCGVGVAKRTRGRGADGERFVRSGADGSGGMNAVVPSGLGFFVLVCGLVGFLGVRRVLFRFFRVVRGGAGVGCAEAEAKQRREGDGGNAVGQCAHNHIPSVGIGLDHSPPSAGGSGTSGILHFLTRVVVRTALLSAQRNITNAQPRAPPPLRPAQLSRKTPARPRFLLLFSSSDTLKSVANDLDCRLPFICPHLSRSVQ